MGRRCLYEFWTREFMLKSWRVSYRRCASIHYLMRNTLLSLDSQRVNISWLKTWNTFMRNDWSLRTDILASRLTRKNLLRQRWQLFVLRIFTFQLLYLFSHEFILSIGLSHDFQHVGFKPWAKGTLVQVKFLDENSEVIIKLIHEVGVHYALVNSLLKVSFLIHSNNFFELRGQIL